MQVRSEFVVFERHSFKNDIPAQMWLEVCKLLIRAGSVSFLLSVTGALV